MPKPKTVKDLYASFDAAFAMGGSTYWAAWHEADSLTDLFSFPELARFIELLGIERDPVSGEFWRENPTSFLKQVIENHLFARAKATKPHKTHTLIRVPGTESTFHYDPALHVVATNDHGSAIVASPDDFHAKYEPAGYRPVDPSRIEIVSQEEVPIW